MKPLPFPALWRDDVTRWKQWLTVCGDSENTVYLRDKQIKRLARDFPDKRPWDLTLEDLTEWLSRYDWSGDTRRSHRTAIRSFYAWATATGIIETDPASALPRSKARQGKPRPASESDIAVGLAGADQRTTMMIRLASELGLRACEIAQVHTDHVVEDLFGYSLNVIGKGNKPRTIPLRKAMAIHIRSHPAGYLFPGRIDGHLSAAYVSKILSRALPAGITAHMLRHRFASRAYQAERDIRAVQELLGHSSPATTAIYTAIPDNALRRAAEAAA